MLVVGHAYICKIVRQHSRTESCLHDLFPCGVLIGVTSAFDSDAVFGKLLVVVAQELGSGRVIRQEEEDE